MTLVVWFRSEHNVGRTKASNAFQIRIGITATGNYHYVCHNGWHSLLNSRQTETSFRLLRYLVASSIYAHQYVSLTFMHVLCITHAHIIVAVVLVVMVVSPRSSPVQSSPVQSSPVQSRVQSPGFTFA